MASKQIIDKVANDGVRLVSKSRDNTANQSAAAPVPFQIDRTVRGLAMDFGPTVRAPRTLVFSWNQIETPKLRIGHDLFPQRSTPARYDLDHGLHFTPSFSRKSVFLQCFFHVTQAILPASFETQTGLSASRQQRAVHHVNIDISLLRMMKRGR